MGLCLSPAVVGPPRFRSVFGAYLAGNLVGGAVLGLLGAACSAAVHAVVPGKLWRPDSSWQVPSRFRRVPYVRLVAFVWGAGLGTGWLTTNVTAAFVSFFVASVAVSPRWRLLAV